MRGDVPWPQPMLVWWPTFSPHARGCSGTYHLHFCHCTVFPACAGMFPPQLSPRNPHHRFPRMRGDVPVSVQITMLRRGFSPHARGCSCLSPRHRGYPAVFPACAGMFLSRIKSTANVDCFPRMRGDVPPRERRRSKNQGFSPHARGCSPDKNLTGFTQQVFPACAGMFRRKSWLFAAPPSFPRMRGDVPLKSWENIKQQMFSPHARGCSRPVVDPVLAGVVFPACAGMFRAHRIFVASNRCFPRMRGDVPRYALAPPSLAGFSPHARGCSPQVVHDVLFVQVFPACAGMFRGF